MAHSSGLSVTDSVVYRSWHIHQPPSSYGGIKAADHQKHEREEIDQRKSSKWSFLQRLLAIEEAHDKRREAKMARKPGSKSHGTKGADVDNENTARSLRVSDSQHRWTYGQVLEESCSTPDNTSPSEAGRESRTSLPPIGTTKTTTDPYLHASSSTYLTTQGTNNHTPKLPRLPEQHQQTPLNNLAPNLTQSQPNLHTGSSAHGNSRQPSFITTDDDRVASPRPKRKRPLRLPPILLPRVYAITPRPLQCREFLTPTKVRGPITDGEWEDLKDCRYIRHALPQYSLQLSSSNLAFQS